MPSSTWMSISSNWVSSRSFLSSAPSGSSSSSTFGRLASARASATRCCWPPESWCGLRSANLLELDERQHLADARADLGLGHAVHLEAEGDVLGHRHMREQRIGLEHHVGRPLDSGGTPARSLPASGDAPAVGSSKPASMRISVVLPQPDGPSSEKNSRSWISSDTSSTAVNSPNRFVTAFEADQRDCARGPSRVRSCA